MCVKMTLFLLLVIGKGGSFCRISQKLLKICLSSPRWLFMIFIASFRLEAAPITFMENFDASQWQYVHINLEHIEKAAIEFSSFEQNPIWNDLLPQGINFEESVNYLLGLISIDFCHWGFDETTHEIKQFYVEESGERVRGSMAMCLLAKRAYEQGVKLFEASHMKVLMPDEFRKYFIGEDSMGQLMEIPMLAERVQVLNEVGSILLERWNGSFLEILKAAKGKEGDLKTENYLLDYG